MELIKTAEAVTPKHPDKLCDQIADAILDACLIQDKKTRSAIEVLGGHGIITVTGELTTNAFVDIPAIVHRIVNPQIGVQVNIVKQSQDIAKGIEDGGAGDQGIMVGYACNETPELMPLEVMLARNLCKSIYEKYPYDGKTQITIKDGKLQTIIASFQNVSKQELEEFVGLWVAKERPKDQMPGVYCNPAGDWTIGGFDADTGLTGRKQIIDAYGPNVPIGGGAFSGKDGTKVDRSGAYMARFLAINSLKELQAKEVFVKIAYAIGQQDPVMAIAIIDGKEENIIFGLLRPNRIIELLKLDKPIFEKTSQWGHFGHQEFPWEK